MLVSTQPASTYIPGEPPNLSLGLSMPLVPKPVQVAPEPALQIQQPQADLSWMDPLLQYMQEEYRKISLAVDRALVREVEWLRAPPSKPRDGIIRGADGTSWNPGGGQGIYCYYNGAWNRLIEIATSATIADGAVTEPKIAANAVTSAKLVDGSVLTAKLADLAVTLAKLGSGAVDTTKLSDGAVTAIKIADGSITLNKHGTNLRPVQIGGTLPPLPDANYPSGAVFFLTTDLKLYRSNGTNWTKAVDGGDITASTITAGAISAGAIGTDALAANAVIASKIAAGAIETTHLAAQAVTAAKIAAGTITTNEIAAATILAANIAALTITGNEIAASTITAGKLSVSQLSAITADMGAITAGTIVLPSGGFIRSGQTAYDTGTGFYIGNDAGTPKLSLGSSTKGITWDGTTFTVRGDVIATANIQAGAVTSAKISVSQLSAISADMGAITAGSIVLPSGGFIRSGQTAYNTGTGFYLGNDSGTPKFSIGQAGSKAVTWDGSTLTITGDVIATGNINADAVSKTQAAYTTGTVSINSTSFVDLASVTLTTTGKVVVITAGFFTWNMSSSYTLRIVRDSTEIYLSEHVDGATTHRIATTQTLATANVTDTPSAGTYTYKVQGKVGATGAAGTNNAARRFITATELKR